MRMMLDAPVFCHGVAVAAVARVTLWPLSLAGGIGVAGGKQPVAILLHDGSTLRGMDLNGRALSETEVETLLPGSGLALGAAWQAWHGQPVKMGEAGFER